MDQQIVLILVGLVGSGKSTFAQALERHFPSFRRCNQDDLGNRRKVEQLARVSLQRGLSVCIDRTNIDELQRAHFIDVAREFPNISVWTIIFDTSYEICASRIMTRTDHPTIKTPELGLSVLERFSSDYHPPTAEEGFDRIATLKPHVTGDYTREELAAILDNIQNMPSPVLPVRSRTLQFFRNEHGAGRRVHPYVVRGAPLSPSSQRVSSDNNVSWRRRASPPRQSSGHSGAREAGVDSSAWRPPRYQ